MNLNIFLIFHFFYLLIRQLAQQLYDESDDHFSQTKSEEDESAKKLFVSAAEKFKQIDSANDEEVRQMIDELSKNIKNINCSYFKTGVH